MLLHPVSPDSRRTELLRTADLVSRAQNIRVLHYTLNNVLHVKWICVSRASEACSDPGEPVLLSFSSQRVTVAASSLDSESSDLQSLEPVRPGLGMGRSGAVLIQLGHRQTQQEMMTKIPQ